MRQVRIGGQFKLSPPEQKSAARHMDIHRMPGHLIRRLNQIAVGRFMERMAQADLSLTPVQFAALCAIRDFPGIDQATVSGLIAYDRATLGKVIDRLETRGLVKRKVSTSDRRARSLELTAQGTELCARARPHVVAIQPEILSGLSDDERATFVSLLDRVTLAGNERSRAPLKSPMPETPD
jgi:DNA-binding MarR family transcriptional regulator